MAHRVCPLWVGYVLACPLRRILQNPEKILAPYIKEGMKVLDVGCAMGFFGLPLAQMVGPDGKVVCVDVQEKMIQSLKKRAKKAGLSDRIETRICLSDSLDLNDLNEAIDFALASAVVHEVPDASGFFSELYQALKQAGKILVLEPKGHVSKSDFEKTVCAAQKNGFLVVGNPEIRGSRAVLLKKDIQEIIGTIGCIPR